MYNKSFFVSYNTRTSYNPSLTYQYPQVGVASRPAIDLMQFLSAKRAVPQDDRIKGFGFCSISDSEPLFMSHCLRTCVIMAQSA